MENERRYCTVVSPNDFITVTLDMFPGGAKPIRWQNQGLTGYVGTDKVANILDDLRDQEKMHTFNKKPVLKIWWSETMSSEGINPSKNSSDAPGVGNSEQPKD